mmetsp:Transcript_15097/g.19136  ORF Transcript_15097/g.19136 Transcript_15097/m.19136 type:complete len:367 (+) Transcript_15097:101-1201(+)
MEQLTSSTFPNSGSASDIMHVLDLLRSSSKHTHLGAISNTERMNKKRTLHEIHDDTIPPLTQSKDSVLSKRSRLDEEEDVVVTSTSTTCSPQGTPTSTNTYTSSNTEKVPPSTVGLSTYNSQDVLSGRGGGTNQHEGNCYFRSLINANREKYLRSKKNDKPFISRSIVNAIRRRNGRFLKKDEKTGPGGTTQGDGLWYEIGDAAAREKTSQALRQRAPEYRRQMYEQDCEAIRHQHQHQPVTPALTMTTKTPPLSPPMSPHLLSSSSRTNCSTTSKALGNLINIPIPSSPNPYGTSCSNLEKDSARSTFDTTSDAVFQMYSATLRQAQQEALRIEQEKAQEALRLEQKLRAIKMLELLTLMGNGAF